MWPHVLTSCLLSLLLGQFLCEEISRQVEEEAGEEPEGGDLISRLLGLPKVWWPHTHLISSGWSLLAAGLSTALLAPSLVPQSRRVESDPASERVFRGVVARPHSWPWIAKLKVRRSSRPVSSSPDIFFSSDHIPTSRGPRQTAGLWRCADRHQVRPDRPALCVLGPQRGGGGRQAGGGLARQPRAGGAGRVQDPGQEDHHQAGLPGPDLRQV